MSKKEWLDSLKYGDEVVVSSGYQGKSLGRVSRTTDTQIVLESGSRFRKKDGRPVGGDQWSILTLTQPTDALRAEILKNNLVEKLRHILWEKHGVETLSKIWELARNGQLSATKRDSIDGVGGSDERG